MNYLPCIYMFGANFKLVKMVQWFEHKIWPHTLRHIQTFLKTLSCIFYIHMGLKSGYFQLTTKTY